MLSSIKSLRDLQSLKKRSSPTLAESVEFESEEEYREKLADPEGVILLCKSRLHAKVRSPTETLSEGVDTTPDAISVSTGMSAVSESAWVLLDKTEFNINSNP